MSAHAEAVEPLFELVGCPPRAPVQARPLLDPDTAMGLAGLFGLLASDTRLRMLHALARTPLLSVNELAVEVGMSPQAVSNQLRRLADRGVVSSRRDGSSVRYRLVDPCVVGLLDLAWCLTEERGEREMRA